MKFLTNLWRFFFPKVSYVVYMNGMIVYKGSSKHDAFNCYDVYRRQLAVTYQEERTRFTASVSIVKRTKGLRKRSEVIKSQTFRGKREKWVI